MQNDTMKQINKAKLHLMTKRNTTFYSALIANLRLEFSELIPTAGTNGINIVFNPKFVKDLNNDEIIGLLLHEAMHVVYQHMDRAVVGDFDKKYWNYAGDYFINNDLYRMGYKLPEGALLNSDFHGKGTKEIYDILMSQKDSEEEQGGGGQGFSEDLLDLDYDLPGGMSESEHHEQVISNTIKAVTQARLSNDYGSVPDNIARRVENLLNPTLPWNTILMNHMSSYARDEYTWRRPNKRYMPDYYLPSQYSESLNQVTVAIDVSGSILQEDLDAFMAEVRYIWDVLNPKKMRIVGFDTCIHDDLEFLEGDSIEDISLTGGGGTDVDPIIKTIKEDTPEISIIFSDGEFHIPNMSEVSSALFWVIKDNTDFKIDTGEVIYYES